MNKFGIFVFVLMLTLTSCKQKEEEGSSTTSLNPIPEVKAAIHPGTDVIEKAHKKGLFQNLGFISANFALSFGRSGAYAGKDDNRCG